MTLFSRPIPAFALAGILAVVLPASASAASASQRNAPPDLAPPGTFEVGDLGFEPPSALFIGVRGDSATKVEKKAEPTPPAQAPQKKRQAKVRAGTEARQTEERQSDGDQVWDTEFFVWVDFLPKLTCVA